MNLSHDAPPPKISYRGGFSIFIPWRIDRHSAGSIFVEEAITAGKKADIGGISVARGPALARELRNRSRPPNHR
jgi:hypothetical protein